MNKIVITKSQIEAIILKEQQEQENYMFFSNLEQIERQCKLLRNIGQDKINELQQKVQSADIKELQASKPEVEIPAET